METQKSGTHFEWKLENDRNLKTWYEFSCWIEVRLSFLQLALTRNDVLHHKSQFIHVGWSLRVCIENFYRWNKWSWKSWSDLRNLGQVYWKHFRKVIAESIKTWNLQTNYKDFWIDSQVQIYSRCSLYSCCWRNLKKRKVKVKYWRYGWLNLEQRIDCSWIMQSTSLTFLRLPKCILWIQRLARKEQIGFKSQIFALQNGLQWVLQEKLR